LAATVTESSAREAAPRDTGDFAGDCTRYSRFWESSAALLARLQIASAAGGRSAVASLVSSDALELDDAQKSLLNRITTEAPGQDAKSAARSVSDCLSKLEIAALTAAKHALEERRETCTDPARQNEIDEELQRITSLRHDLQKKVRQV